MAEKVESAYGAEQIQVLDGLEHIRKRPGMYISSTDEKGLHHLVSEVVDNSIDEALAGYCNRVDVTINADGSCTVEDNGRGIPTAVHPKEGISTVEVVFTKVNAGGKFGGDSGYKVSSGLHGVGVKAVNALSEWLDAEIFQNGHVYKQTYNRGVPQRALAVVGDTEKTGTKVTFYPDADIFETIVFKYDTLKVRLKELAFLNKGLTITLTDKREGKEKNDTFLYEGGIKELVEELNRANNTLFPEPLYFEAQEGTTVCEIAIQYNESYNEVIYSYASSLISMGAAPPPTFRFSHQLPLLPITWRWRPQNSMSGLWLRKMPPKGVWPESEGRDSMTYMPLILRGKSTALRLKGMKGFSSRVKVLKSLVSARPMEAP